MHHILRESLYSDTPPTAHRIDELQWFKCLDFAISSHSNDHLWLCVHYNNVKLFKSIQEFGFYMYKILRHFNMNDLNSKESWKILA